jgi:atypical dual specificity phosphatase
MAGGLRTVGEWIHRGRPLHEADPEIAVLPQKPGHRPTGFPREVREFFETPAKTLLIDEPERRVDEAHTGELAKRIRERARDSAVIVVAHDLAFAKSIADDVILLVAGRIEARDNVFHFFDHPASELAARFVRQGNCWLPPPDPKPPSHFHWVIPNRLAGMGRPGLLNDVDDDLSGIAAAGINLLVSLTEDPFPTSKLRPFGLRGRHLPIPDMGVPAVGPTASLCREIARAIQEEERVAVHCHAGMGRTGTILAAVLVWMGDDPDVAIGKVRKVARGYIQNKGQLHFVRSFAESVGKP